MLKLQFYIAMSFCVGILTSSGADNVWLGAERTEDTWVWTDGSPGKHF